LEASKGYKNSSKGRQLQIQKRGGRQTAKKILNWGEKGISQKRKKQGGGVPSSHKKKKMCWAQGELACGKRKRKGGRISLDLFVAQKKKTGFQETGRGPKSISPPPPGLKKVGVKGKKKCGACSETNENSRKKKEIDTSRMEEEGKLWWALMLKAGNQKEKNKRGKSDRVQVGYYTKGD